MTGLQLELNIEDKSPDEMKIYLMQKQIDAMSDSMGKVRRKLFGEMSEMKKLYAELYRENQELKAALKDLKNENTEWIYGENGSLFEMAKNAG